MRKSVGVMIALFASIAILAFAAMALAQTATWSPSTGWTDNTGATGTFTADEMATMKFYLRARKQGDTNARKYFGETSGGVSTWTGDFASIFPAKGLAVPTAGEKWEVTVSQAFKGADGIERDSAQSAPYIYTFPFGPPRIPVAPGAVVVTD